MPRPPNKPPDIVPFPALRLIADGKAPPTVLDQPVVVPPGPVDAKDGDYRPTEAQKVLRLIATEGRAKGLVTAARWIVQASLDERMEGLPPVTFETFNKWCEDQRFRSWFFAPLYRLPSAEEMHLANALLYELVVEKMAEGSVSAAHLHAQMTGQIKRVEAEAPVDLHGQMEEFRKRGEVAPPPASPAASKWRMGTGGA